MSKFSFWHWPDHVIYKRESRRLRDEHNAVMNSHARLLKAAILAEELLRKHDDLVKAVEHLLHITENFVDGLEFDSWKEQHLELWADEYANARAALAKAKGNQA